MKDINTDEHHHFVSWLVAPIPSFKTFSFRFLYHSSIHSFGVCQLLILLHLFQTLVVVLMSFCVPFPFSVVNVGNICTWFLFFFFLFVCVFYPFCAFSSCLLLFAFHFIWWCLVSVSFRISKILFFRNKQKM